MSQVTLQCQLYGAETGRQGSIHCMRKVFAMILALLHNDLLATDRLTLSKCKTGMDFFFYILVSQTLTSLSKISCTYCEYCKECNIERSNISM